MDLDANYWCAVCCYVKDADPTQKCPVIMDKVTLKDEGKGTFIKEWKYEHIKKPEREDLAKMLTEERMKEAKKLDWMEKGYLNVNLVLENLYKAVQKLSPEVIGDKEFLEWAYDLSA